MPGSNGSVTMIELRRPHLETLQLRLVGDSSLICHKWSEKAKKEMLDKQMGKARTKKEAKDPKRDFVESLYPMPDGDGYGFPAIGFKNAAVTACTQISGITKVLARGAFHVEGDLVRIEGTPQPREDMVRVGMGTADIRYRGEFLEWACTISVRFNADVLNPEQISHLFQHAGFAVGIGEWRPEKDGNHGMFSLVGSA
jgi:hypothetical protein